MSERDGRAGEGGEHPVLDDVRRATRQKGKHPLPSVEERIVRAADVGDDLRACFETRARALGVVVHRVGPERLREALTGRLEEGGQAGPVVLEPALLERFPALAGLGETDPDDETLFAARYGITGVTAAIAETGSFVVASGSGRWRQFSLVPPVHFAVVEERQLVADLLDVLLQYGGTVLPANFVVVTGPSRTADIAQRLVTGVHGPGTVECFLVGEG